MKTTFKKFYFLMSAMLFIGKETDKDGLILQLFHQFHDSNFLNAEEFAINYFKDNKPGVDNVYIRETFNLDKYLGHAESMQTS